MFINYRFFNLCSFILLITFLSSTASFCSNLTSIDDKDTPCFLEPPTDNPILLRTSGNGLVLPCHVARSKSSTVEWWYTDSGKLINTKIYPVYPAVRPTVLRFVTSSSSYLKNSTETDIIDASVLLLYANVDDSGIYRCVIRSRTMESLKQIEYILSDDNSKIPTLRYQVQLTGPRFCQSNPSLLPCFSAMRTASSPAIIDAYQTAFLQCIVKNYDRPVSVFWVIGDSSMNSVLITDYLTTNQYNGDRLRRVFPHSPFDYSLELSVNRNAYERTYSCVIEGATDVETTLFTYIVRTIDLEEVSNKTLNGTHNAEKITAHDVLNREQIHSLHENRKIIIDEDNFSEEEDLREVSREEEDEQTEETTISI